MADLSAIMLKNTNPNVSEGETFIVLDASEIRRRASLVATILWKFWNHYNLQTFEGVAGTPDLGYQNSPRRGNSRGERPEWKFKGGEFSPWGRGWGAKSPRGSGGIRAGNLRPRPRIPKIS
ncbi:hypothetical protein PIB30_030564 [Stylosanthes scabra]|uniref:Uncharacterized protein n=1 Tax=Stylosanthes scabra TaxID=79078 RepID=A0ABU6SBW8_9FABA|nr:hypothetical protein [Stylosanthes scabra]